MKYINPYRRYVGAFIPNWLLERPEVSHGAKIIYGRLCQHAGRDGQAFPSQVTLASEVGLRERQVRAYLSELKQHGLLEENRRGLGKTSFYRFLSHEWQDDAALIGEGLPLSSGETLPLEENQLRDQGTQSSESSQNFLPPERKGGAFRERFLAASKTPDRLAVAIDYFASEHRPLSKEQRSHLGGILQKNGGGDDMWHLIAGAITAKGSPTDFIEGAFKRERAGRLPANRQPARRGGARVAGPADIKAAERYAAGDT